MKKFLLGTLFWLVAAQGTLWAAYQYNDYISHDNNFIYLSQDADLSFEFQSSYQNNQSISKNWDTMTIVATSASGTTTSRTVALTGGTVDIGSYSAGDQLQLFVTNKQNITSTAAWYGTTGWNPTTNYNEYLLFNVHYDPNSHYDQYAFKVTGTAVSSQPATGQPLPGAVAALLLGGCIVSIYGLKKRLTVCKSAA